MKDCDSCISIPSNRSYKYFGAGGIGGGLVYPDAGHAAPEELRIAGPITTLVRKSARLSTNGISRRSISRSRIVSFNQ